MNTLRSIFSNKKEPDKSITVKNNEFFQQVEKFEFCFKTFEIFGLHFFNSSDIESGKSDEVRSPSKRRIFYMLFILIALIAFVTVFVSFEDDVVDDSEDVTIDNVVMVAVEGLMSAAFFAIIVVTIIESFFRNKEWIKFHVNTIKIMKEMKQMGVDDIFDDFGKRSKRNTVVVIIIFFVIHVSVGIIELKSDFVQMIAFTIFATLPMLFTLMLTIRTIFYVSMVNHLLLKLSTNFHNLYRFHLITSLNLDDSPVKVLVDPVKSLLVVRNCYNLILKNSMILNKIWGFCLLCFSLGHVVSLTVSMYEFFVDWVDGLTFNQFIGDL